MLYVNNIIALILTTINTIITLVIAYQLLKRLDIILKREESYDDVPSVEYTEDDDIEEDYRAAHEYMIEKLKSTIKTPSEFIEQQITQEDDSIEIITDSDEYKAQVMRRGY